MTDGIPDVDDMVRITAGPHDGLIVKVKMVVASLGGFYLEVDNEDSQKPLRMRVPLENCILHSERWRGFSCDGV